MSGLHFHTLKVSQVQPEADDALLLSFDVPAGLRELFRFQPGQYLTLRRQLGGEDLRRSYSICSVVGEALRVGIRRVPGGKFSTWACTALQPGQTLEVMPPQGRFGAALGRETPGAGAGDGARHVLAIAGGSGITPLLSIIKTVLTTETASRVSLLYGNRTAASTLFKEELQDLKNRYLTRLAWHPVYSREAVDSALHSGRLDSHKLATLLRLCGPIGPADEAFVCGPHALNDEAQASLLAAGYAASQVHIERFGVPPSAADAAPQAAAVGDASSTRLTIVRDGLSRDVPYQSGESLLAAAARAGLDVPYSCKSGVCATCRAKLIEGQVRMARNFALQAEELAAGFVLTCQAHPLSGRVVVSFDER